MNAYDCLTYTFLALILLYIVNKIRQNINEDFHNERKSKDSYYENTIDMNIDEYHEYDDSHHYSEDDFKFGKTEMMGILDNDNDDIFGSNGCGKDNEYNDTNIESFSGSLGNNNKKNCGIDANELDADTYIRNRLLTGSDSIKKNYSKDELKLYRDNHFAFRNNVWQTSKDVDMVDKINDMYFSGNYDLTRNRKGTRIADLFNDLTKNEDKLEQTCITNMTSSKSIDRIMDQKSRKTRGHNGNMLSEDLWFYNKEKTMNGGDFYNGIKPFEGICSVNQAL